MVKKLPKGEIFFFFLIIYFTFFLSPYGKKQNHLLFSPFFITGSTKSGKENVSLKNFFSSSFLTFLDPTAPRNRKNDHLPFFSNFRLKVPKTAAKGAQVPFFSHYLFSPVIMRTYTPNQTHSIF